MLSFKQCLTELIDMHVILMTVLELCRCIHVYMDTCQLSRDLCDIFPDTLICLMNLISLLHGDLQFIVCIFPRRLPGSIVRQRLYSSSHTAKLCQIYDSTTNRQTCVDVSI